MSIQKIILASVIGLIFPITNLFSQELICNVVISDQQVQTQERQVFQKMQKAISTFMNTTKWTQQEVQEHEKIRCNIMITLGKNSSVIDGTYEGIAQIQSSRIVYGTNFETPMLSFFDKNFQFKYLPDQPIIYTENVTTNNLSLMLAFYAYAILGIDYDSFGKQGGNGMYEKVNMILNNSLGGTDISSSGGKGWADEPRERTRASFGYDLINPQMSPVRESIYEYHRIALDHFSEDPDAARKKIHECLKKIKSTLDIRPNSILISAFFDAKAEELYQIYSKSEDPVLRKEISTLLMQLDPTNANLYKKLDRP